VAREPPQVSPIWRHKEEIAVVSGDNRAVVLDLDRLDLLPVVLTDTAAAIWQAVDGERDDEAVIAQVAEEFEIDADEVREQILAFLEDLAARDLIVRV